MTNDEITKNLYECVINNNELTTEILNDYGIDSKNINLFIEKGILKTTNEDNYALTLINELFLYAKHLLSEKNTIHKVFMTKVMNLLNL